MKSKTQKVVMAAMVAALTAVATMIIKIQSPLGGYVNLGDSMVLFAGWMLSPAYGLLAAGLGSALADVILGYISYAPATFIIKALMAVSAYLLFTLLAPKCKEFPALLISGVVAEIIMILGYYLFESIFFYGFAAAAVNIPANAMQGLFGIIAGSLLTRIFKKKNFLHVK